jgi:thiosulfate/3-mercaptopyruvate sulfurtransferase
MPFTTLVDPTSLAARLDDPTWAIVDCRFSLEDATWGAREYAARHVRGAVYADMNTELAGTRTGRNGRHPLPEVDALRHTLGRLGVGPGNQVVVYDQDGGMYASRLWWLLRWLGHDHVALLDGGFARWIREDRPTSTGIETRLARVFEGEPRAHMLVTTTEVAAIAAGAEGRLVDARAPERYRGDVEPVDRVAGHIPGAVNLPYRNNIAEDGTLLPAADLARRWREAVGEGAPDRLVCYCGSGITACHNLLALEIAGLGGARLYAGSWSEWSSDPANPVEKGESTRGA